MERLNKYYDISLNHTDIENLIIESNIESKKITSKYELDSTEKTVCWLAGISAGLVDAFLVTNYKNLSTENITKLNGHLKDSGKINHIVDNRIKNLFSSSEISNLEKKFKVPYDASTNKHLKDFVSGLNPKTHRAQSLGHDPILGFYYGVRDILNGEFTAVDNAGDIIGQKIADNGMGLFEAICVQFGHLCSDISTSAGLPFPFMSQLLRLKGGNIEGFTYNRLIKNMYAKGYSFNHLLTMSVPALIIEVVTRLSYFIISLNKGMSFLEAIPVNKIKLDNMLFNSYLIASGCNGIKLIATNGNIFAFNPVLWGKMIQYGTIQLKRYFSDEKEKERHKYVFDLYERQGRNIDKVIEENLNLYIN
jgi:hypothetical protein